MGKQFKEINRQQQQFIENQKLFFVGTAASDGRVNVSPKGLDSLRVLSPKRVLWLNLTGSGNETAAHLLENTRMTLMFCALEGNPMILRLYGQAKIFHTKDTEWQDLAKHFPAMAGARQILDMEIEMVQTSCGFGIPIYEYQEDRSILIDWSAEKGPEGMEDYWHKKNKISIDGKPRGI